MRVAISNILHESCTSYFMHERFINMPERLCCTEAGLMSHTRIGLILCVTRLSTGCSLLHLLVVFQLHLEHIGVLSVMNK